MNLYYQKYGPAKVSEIIEKASHTWEQTTGVDSYRCFMEENVALLLTEIENDVDRPSNLLASSLLHANKASIKNLAQHDSAFWQLDIDGICPNGRTMCDTGGPVSGTKNGKRPTPVEGGAGNCPRCKYWVTGPMFLAGQLIKANVLLYKLHESSLRIVKLQDELNRVQSHQNPCKHDLHKVRTAIDAAQLQIENDLHTWVRRYQHIAQSIELQENHDSNSEMKFPLIIHDEGRPSFSLSESHPLDLMEFAAQCCEVFPTIDAGTAALKQSKAIDTLLDRNKIKPFLFGLPDDLALQTGNQLTNFLNALLPRESVIGLLEGSSTFESLGLPRVSVDAIKMLARQATQSAVYEGTDNKLKLTSKEARG